MYFKLFLLTSVLVVSCEGTKKCPPKKCSQLPKVEIDVPYFLNHQTFVTTHTYDQLFTCTKIVLLRPPKNSKIDYSAFIISGSNAIALDAVLVNTTTSNLQRCSDGDVVAWHAYTYGGSGYESYSCYFACQPDGIGLLQFLCIIPAGNRVSDEITQKVLPSLGSVRGASDIVDAIDGCPSTPCVVF